VRQHNVVLYSAAATRWRPRLACRYSVMVDRRMTWAIIVMFHLLRWRTLIIDAPRAAPLPVCVFYSVVKTVDIDGKTRQNNVI